MTEFAILFLVFFSIQCFCYDGQNGVGSGGGGGYKLSLYIISVWAWTDH